jgi:DNA-directed RNA polymerase specialized sigma24 family protein
MWGYVLKYRSGLFNLCKRYARNTDEAHELFSDVVLERLPRLLEVSDSWSYVSANLKWYLFKHVSGVNGEKPLPLTDIEEEPSYITDQDDAIEVISILRGLPTNIQQVIHEHFWEERTIVQIAESRDLTYHQARQLILYGLELMWERLA